MLRTQQLANKRFCFKGFELVDVFACPDENDGALSCGNPKITKNYSFSNQTAIVR